MKRVSVAVLLICFSGCSVYILELDGSYSGTRVPKSVRMKEAAAEDRCGRTLVLPITDWVFAAGLTAAAIALSARGETGTGGYAVVAGLYALSSIDGWYFSRGCRELRSTLPSTSSGTAPVPTGPAPTGPVPTGPVPAGPLPAGPLPAGPLPDLDR